MGLATGRVLGLILAGGAGARLGGRVKAFELLAGRPLIAHVLARLAPQCDGLALSLAQDDPRLSALGLTVLRDPAAPQREGPMAGLLAGLSAAASQSYDALLTAAVDTPLLPRDLRERLEAARQAAGAPASIAASGGQAHPVFGLWDSALAPKVSALYAEGLRAPRDLARKIKAATAAFSVVPYDPFLNLNSENDRAALEGAAQQAEGED